MEEVSLGYQEWGERGVAGTYHSGFMVADRRGVDQEF